MSNPITLEKWTNNSHGQTVTVIRGLVRLDVRGNIVLLIQEDQNDKVLVIYPNGDGQFASFASLAKEGYTLQPEEALPPTLTALEVGGNHTDWDIN